MEADEPQDWVDRVMARDEVWEPPPHFSARLVVHAMHALPARRASVVRTLPELVLGAGRSVAAQAAMSLWVLRQYRSLLFS